MTVIGPIGEKIQELGIPVYEMRMRRGIPNPLSLVDLAVRLRKISPQVIQTWGYHADLMGGLAAKMAGGVPVVWGIHHTTFDPKGTKRMTVLTAKMSARLSKWLPKHIICCSETSRLVHTQLGYATDRMSVIPNGFDLSVFHPDADARQSVRNELGISGDTPLIGLFARFDPQKDHQNFIQAGGLLLSKFPECHFLLCGFEITWENPALVSWINAAGIQHRCHLLGPRDDIPRLTAALDIASTASSFGEAFPLVVGEAMASGVPSVVTDIGDSALIVGDTGVVVPPKNAQALADGWMKLLRLSPEERKNLGVAARQRISDLYNLEMIVSQYEQVYETKI